MSAPSLSGKVCVVTGFTSGIGYETALALAKRNATLILVGRSPDLCREKAQAIAAAAASAVPTVVVADLCDSDQVKRAAQDILSHTRRIDVLVNNAGGIFAKRETTPQGFEKTFALNVLAPLILTRELLPALHAGARVLNLSSLLHESASFRPDDLNWEKKGFADFGMGAYGTAKLHLAMATATSAERLKDQGVHLYFVHPGVVATRFGRNNGGVMSLIMKIAAPFLISPEKGARTTVWGATEPSLETQSGAYLKDARVATPHPAVRDPQLRQQLWDALESACKERLLPSRFAPPAAASHSQAQAQTL